MPSQPDVPPSASQQPASTVLQGSISQGQPEDDQPSSQIETFEEQTSPAATHPVTMSAAPHDIPSSLQSEALRDGAHQPTPTVLHPSNAVIQPDAESISQDSAQPQPNCMQAQSRSNRQADSRNIQPCSTITQASIQADQPVDDNSSLTSARQPDSSHLLQSTEVQQPADMSVSLNNHQGDNQPSSTIPLQSLEDAQQPHDDMGSI